MALVDDDVDEVLALVLVTLMEVEEVPIVLDGVGVTALLTVELDLTVPT